MSTRLLHDKFFKLAKVHCHETTPVQRHKPPPPLSPALHPSLPPGGTRAGPAWTSCLLQAQQYVARSAYKLLDIQQKHKIIAPGAIHVASHPQCVPRLPSLSFQCHVYTVAGSRVLDLGCAPGAWLQVACQALGRGDRGLVLGVDLKPVSMPTQHCDRRVRTLQADVNSLSESVLREHCPQVWAQSASRPVPCVGSSHGHMLQ